MSRIFRLVVLATSVAALVGAMAGTASAVTWDVAGSGSFNATAPPGTYSVTSTSLSCSTWDASGAYVLGSLGGNVYTGLTGTMTLSNCLGGPIVWEITCGYRFTAFAQPAATVVTGNLDATCGLTVASTGQKLCHIAWSPHAIYTDRPAPTPDTLTLTTASFSIGGSSCFLGTNDTAHMSEITFTLTNAGPHIVRTA